MTSTNGKTPVAAPSAAPAVPTSESNRTKSIATRLTDAEFFEIESAAAGAGKKVAEWLREAALRMRFRNGSGNTIGIAAKTV
jgi:hypothetical protein